MANMLQYFGELMVSATRYRRAAGAYDAAGNWVEGAETTKTIRILKPQPVSGRDLRLIPEGEEVTDFVMTGANAGELFTRETTVDPDEVLACGTRYVVSIVRGWTVYDSFDKVILKKKQ